MLTSLCSKQLTRKLGCFLELLSWSVMYHSYQQAKLESLTLTLIFRSFSCQTKIGSLLVNWCKRIMQMFCAPKIRMCAISKRNVRISSTIMRASKLLLVTIKVLTLWKLMKRNSLLREISSPTIQELMSFVTFQFSCPNLDLKTPGKSVQH